MSVDVLLDFLRIPVGDSQQVIDRFIDLPNAIHKGKGLKQFVWVPGTNKKKVCLVAHADTVWEGSKNNDPLIKDNGKIYRNSSQVGLGADDRAGCAMLWALRNSGHSLLVVNGEESGSQGVRYLKEVHPHMFDLIQQHQFFIQLDRRNGKDFKCYEVGTDEFRKYVSENTEYTEPDRHSFTDITMLCEQVTGVNLSIGYYNEHTIKEYLVIDEWLNTLDKVTKILNSPNIPKFKLEKKNEPRT